MEDNNGRFGQGEKSYTVLLLDPDTEFRDKWKAVLEFEKFKVISSGSLEELLEQPDQGDFFVAAVGENANECLSKILAQRSELPVLALVLNDETDSTPQIRKDISEILRAYPQIVAVPHPPPRDWLISYIKNCCENSRQKKVLGFLPPESELLINALFSDLKKRRTVQCMEKVNQLCRYEGDVKVSRALFRFVTKTVKMGLKIQGIELNAYSTDSFYSAYGHIPMMKMLDGCYKGFLKKKRADCDRLFLTEMEKRQNEHKADNAMPEVALLQSKKTLVNAVRLKSKEMLNADGGIYLHMDYVNGPNLNSIAPEIKEAVDNDDDFAKYFAHSVRFCMNEWLAALQANPVHLPGIRREKLEYYQGIRTTFAKVVPHLRMRITKDEHLALRTAIKSFMDPLSNYEPVQYFDMCSKNIMFEINGAYNSKFDDIRNDFMKWRGKNKPAVTMDEVFDYVKDVMRKVDWNKTYRRHHPADDARHETPSLPISFDDSDMLNIHMLAVKEKERIINGQLAKVKNSPGYRLASSEFRDDFAKVDQLDKLSNDIVHSPIKLSEARKKLKKLVSRDMMAKFDEYQRAVPATWLYRSMRTFGLTLLNYLPSVWAHGIDARRQMADCYVNSDAGNSIECGKEGALLEERIAGIISQENVQDRRPFVGGKFFVPQALEGSERYVNQEKLKTYTEAVNNYFQSCADDKAFKDEMEFCLKRMQAILDRVIKNAPKSLTKIENKKLIRSIENGREYFDQMRHIRKEYDHTEEVLQYAGALYLRKFMDKFVGSEGLKMNYIARRNAS